MRIIAGNFKGRTLSWPKTPLVRPMSDLVRESLFNLLGPLDGQIVLDAYAGSGAIGFEALSRGAAKVEAVEILRQAHTSIRRNIDQLGVGERYHLHPIAIELWVSRPIKTRFDLAVAGPPYATLNLEVLNQLAKLLTSSGIFVVWHSSRIPPPELQSLRLTDNRKYGDSSLSFYSEKS